MKRLCKTCMFTDTLCGDCKISIDGYVCPICGKEKKPGRKTCGPSCGAKLTSLRNGSPFSRKDVRDKAKQTILKRYGSENIWGSDHGKASIKRTSMEKHGGIGFGSESVKKKINTTMLIRYGAEQNSQTDDWSKKFKKTCEERYGCGSYLGSKKYYEDLKNKYGVDNVRQLDKTKQTTKETMLVRYGGIGLGSKVISEKIMKTNLSKYGSKYPCQVTSVKEKMLKTCQRKYKVNWPCQTIKAASFHQISKINLRWKNIFSEMGLNFKLEKRLGNFSYDLYSDELNLLIDINPTITHQSTKDVYMSFGLIKKSDKIYHITKYNFAVENSYRCVFIWDWDSIEDALRKIKSASLEKHIIPNRHLYCINNKEHLIINNDYDISSYLEKEYYEIYDEGGEL